MSSPKLDSDLLLARYRCNSYNDPYSDLEYYSFDNSMTTCVITFVVFVNFTVMLCGLYVIKLAATLSTNPLDYVLSTQIKGILFWSVFSVFLFINLTCFVVELYLSSIFIFTLPFIYFFMNVPMICLFTLIEICVITVIGKNIKVSDHICCIYRPFIVRAVHCYALCNMLWFAHRVANCFIVSIYFISVYPPQTIAVITLLLSTIIIVIAGLTSVILICYSNTTNKCSKICNTITILIIVLCIIITLVLFTIIFVDLTLHGLSASRIGSILLSMAIPSLIFALGLMIKRHLKRKDGANWNINSSGSSEYQPLGGESTT